MAQTTKTLKEIRRGDKVVSPRGIVTITNFRENWEEDFRNTRKSSGVITTTLEGKLANGQSVRFTAPSTATIQIEA